MSSGVSLQVESPPAVVITDVRLIEDESDWSRTCLPRTRANWTMSETHYGRVIYSGRANWAAASTGSRRWEHEGERVGRTHISLALALERIGWEAAQQEQAVA